MVELNYTAGVMGAGKSAFLIENYNNDKRCKVALAAHLELPTGSLVAITSRNGQSIVGLALSPKEENLKAACDSLIDGYFAEVVYIDEVQFLPSETVSFIIHYCVMKGIDLEIFGLDKDFRNQYFDSAKYLLAVSKSVKWINRTCETEGCSNVATSNARFIDGKIVKDGDTFLEAKSSYKSVCRKCYNS